MAASKQLEELRVLVQKDSTDRLIAEMLVSQSIFSETQVKNFTRSQIINYETQLRYRSGDTISVRTLIAGFDPNDKKFLFEESPHAEAENPFSLLAATPAHVDSTAMLLAFFQSMTIEQNRLAEEREKRAEEARIAENKRIEEARIAESQKALERETRAEEARVAENKRMEEARVAENKRQEDIRKTETDRIAARDKAEADRIAARDKAESDRIFARDKKMEEDRKAEFQLLEDARKTEAQRIFDRDKAVEDDRIKREDRLNEERHKEVDRKADLELKRIAELSRKDNRLASAVKATKNLFYKMPGDSISLVLYFRQVEDIFLANSIDDDLKVLTLSSFLNDKARRIQAAMDPKDRDNFVLFKNTILKEFCVTPATCRADFKNAVRNSSESYAMFATRLKALLDAYINSRSLNHTFNDLRDLLLSDKLRDTLSYGEKKSISEREIDAWLKVEDIAKYADAYQAFQTECQLAKNENVFSNAGSKDTRVTSSFSNNQRNNRRFTQNYKSTGQKFNSGDPCRYCNKPGHTIDFCHARQANNSASYVKPAMKPSYPQIKKMGAGKPQVRFSEGKSFKANAVTLVEQDDLCDGDVIDTDDNDNGDCYDSCDNECAEVNRVSVQFTTGDSVNSNTGSDLLANKLEYLKSLKSRSSEDILQIQFGDNTKCTSAILDTGSQVSVLKPSMLPANFLDHGGSRTNIQLQGAFGPIFNATLINIGAKLLGENSTNENHSNVLLTIAVTDELKSNNALICKSDYDTLKCHNEVCIPSVQIVTKSNVLSDVSKNNNTADLIDNSLLGKLNS